MGPDLYSAESLGIFTGKNLVTHNHFKVELIYGLLLRYLSGALVRTVGTYRIVTNLVIGDNVSNIIHEPRDNLDVLIIWAVIHSLDAFQHPSKLMFDPIERARKVSALD